MLLVLVAVPRYPFRFLSVFGSQSPWMVFVQTGLVLLTMVYDKII